MYDNEYVLELNKYTMKTLNILEYLDEKKEKNKEKSVQKENTEN